MILELDIGNSRIKWRGTDGGQVRHSGYAVGRAELARQLELLGQVYRACRVSAVRSAEARLPELVHVLESCVQGSIVFAASTASLAGVVNGYRCPEQLGVDRWLAVVAGYRLVAGACVVIDAGTAMTVDYVQRDGVHLGGLIAPGYAQLRYLLARSTGLEEDAVNMPSGPQQDTEGCLAAGVAAMLQGFVVQALLKGNELMGSHVPVLVTGGDAALIQQFAGECRLVDDLVFRGLSLACPL